MFHQFNIKKIRFIFCFSISRITVFISNEVSSYLHCMFSIFIPFLRIISRYNAYIDIKELSKRDKTKCNNKKKKNNLVWYFYLIV